MKKKIACSLIEDLLPLYVEGLVNEHSKKIIEEHLKNCLHCTKTLQEIKEDNKIFLCDAHLEDNDNIDREKKCIKNIKKRILIKTIIIVIISITLTILFAYILNTYRIMKDENGKYYIYNLNTGNIKYGIEGINILAEYTINNNAKEIKYNTIFTFNKNDICINARTVISGYNEKELENFKNSWKNSMAFSNIKIENQKLYTNFNIYIGKNKEDILKSLKDYNAIILEI